VYLNQVIYLLKKDIEDKFFLRVFAISEIEFEIIPPLHLSYDIINIEGEWNKNNSGGSMNLYSWYLNNQYVIQTDKDVVVSIRLSQDDSNENPFNLFCYLLKGNIFSI
jgi:hypothetical protein